MVLLSRHCCSRAGAVDGVDAAGVVGAVRTWSLSRSARSALTPRFRTRGSKPSPAAAASSTRHASRAGCGASGNAPSAVLRCESLAFYYVCPLEKQWYVITRLSPQTIIREQPLELRAKQRCPDERANGEAPTATGRTSCGRWLKSWHPRAQLFPFGFAEVHVQHHRW